jgi:putative hydrolase of the HAD superfamily
MVEKFEKGLVDPKEFVACLGRALEVPLEYGEFCRMWNCIFYGQLIPDAVLESLARRYRMVLLSNTNTIHFQMIRENYPLLRYFDELVLSFEVHAMKPEPAIFQAAIERAGCRPDECFYTDDIGDFVEAARRQGIDAVQFESADQLQREMQGRGISWQ